MTTEQLTQIISNTGARWNNILYAQKNEYDDGIPNLADLKATYARKNGERWDILFNYRAGEVVSLGNDLYVSLIQNNTGNNPIESPDKWLSISTNSLVSGNFFVGAFCNFTISSNQIIIENNYNIESIINDSSFGFNTLELAGLNLIVRMSETSNISGFNYIVMTNINKVNTTIKDNTNFDNISRSLQRARDIMPYNKEERKFKLGGIYERNTRYSLVVVPGIQ